MAVNKVVYGSNTIIDITDTTAIASDVAQGKYFYTKAGVRTEGTATGGSAAIVVTEEPDTGGGVVKNITAVDISNDTVDAAHLLQGYTAHDSSGNAVTGSYVAPSTQTKTATPSESQQTITPDSGYLLSSVTVGAISSSYVGSGITRRSSTDLTASGATVTVPSGYYSSQASKAVTSGSEGTPTATKGSVSNHSVSVTPSVTNTTGYISGGTHNGTAVTVSASELVSGSETITENDTYDVTNLAEIVVNVPSGGGSVTVTDEPNATGTTCVITSGGSPVPPTPSGTWETVWQGSKAPNADTPYNYFWFNEMGDVYPVDGSVWRITADGTPYICTAYPLALEYQTVIAIGNPKYSGGTDDGSSAPFNFYNAGWGALVGDTDLSISTHSFIFERQVST